MARRNLTREEVFARIAELKTGEIPEDVEYVGYPKAYYPGSPRDFYGMFPEQLCEHGIRRELCYPCTPLEGGENESLPVDTDSEPF